MLFCIVQPNPADPTDLSDQESTIPWIKGFIGESDDATEPLTAIYYPILAEAGNAVSIANVNDRDTKLVAVLAL
jgi:hypothetical protein